MMLIISFAVIAVSIILDQITKVIALNDLKPIVSHSFIEGLIEFRFTTNPGIGWGLLKGMRWLFVPVSSIAIVLVIFALVKYRKKLSPLLSVSMAMIAGGGIGNQIDRIFRGEVIDFLNFQFIDFPIFNVADCFVSVGCVLAVISVLFIDKWILFDDKDKKKVSGEKNDK